MIFSLEEWFDTNSNLCEAFGRDIEIWTPSTGATLTIGGGTSFDYIAGKGYDHEYFHSAICRGFSNNYHFLWSEEACYTVRLYMQGADIFLQLFSEQLLRSADWYWDFKEDYYGINLFKCGNCACHNDKLVGAPCTGKDPRITIFEGFISQALL